jgi:hypothetical protein
MKTAGKWISFISGLKFNINGPNIEYFNGVLLGKLISLDFSRAQLNGTTYKTLFSICVLLFIGLFHHLTIRSKETWKISKFHLDSMWQFISQIQIQP